MRRVYIGLTVDMSDDDARALFQKREGHPPLEVIRNAGAVLVGPLGVMPERKPSEILRQVQEAQQLTLEGLT